jgi:uncharacterized protein (DUF302 family)
MKSSFLVDTTKSFEQACSDLKASISSHDFGLLAIRDLASILRGNNISLAENCRVFEVCNPLQASRVIQVDISLSTALPCRISVFTEAGQTRIGMISSVELLGDLSSIPELVDIAQEVDSSMTDLIQQAASSPAVCSTR